MTPDAVTVANGMVAVDLANGFGPRVVGLRPSDDVNLFAKLGGLGIDLDDGRRFSFRGGHRLWLAPEVPEITYEPDDAPVKVTSGSTYAVISGRAGGIEKAIRVEVATGERVITVDHRISNHTNRAIDLAAWPITQFRIGGTALLPFGEGRPEPARLQASSIIVAWSYTDWASLECDAVNGVLHISGDRQKPTKIGTPLSRGWLAYVLDGWLFAKYATPEPTQIDHGAQAQIYANADFVELETLGPLVALGPGASAEHREVWRVWPAPGSVREAAVLVESWRPFEPRHSKAC